MGRIFSIPVSAVIFEMTGQSIVSAECINIFPSTWEHGSGWNPHAYNPKTPISYLARLLIRSYHGIKLFTENATDTLFRFYAETMQCRPEYLLKLVTQLNWSNNTFCFSLIYSFPFEKTSQTQSSSDSSKKKHSLLHFGGISVLIELILSGKAKLSMASCKIIYLIAGK